MLCAEIFRSILSIAIYLVFVWKDPEGEYGKKYMPMHSFRNMFVAGEHCDKETMEWTKKVFDCPVLDNWWQTGICITTMLPYLQ